MPLPAHPLRLSAVVPGSIRTPRLLLRPMLDSDRERYLDALRASRAELDRWMPLHLEGETDDRLFDRQVRLCRDGERARTCWRRVAILDDASPAAGAIAGQFNINAISRGLEWGADVNWWVRTDLCSRGYASEAARALIDHAFAPLPRGLGLHRLSCGIVPDNQASVRLARRLGFARRGDERTYLASGSTWMLHELWSRGPRDVPIAPDTTRDAEPAD
ncbi:MAG: GNAT family N-acetyltransferase [Phycisphaerales bacterium]|nr:GNAT family N-acetyltransferase [Phycisphaerales bacterium]